MSKRAVIYVRVSSERQAEGVSPEAQEADCKALCMRNGYSVAGIYRDTEKYRVRGRMVEPSGTRSDRPQFLRMLKDFDEGNFDVLICWREDRLYRGVTRAVVELKERIKRDGLSIETVNGGFSISAMEVLAWAAGVENEARTDRRNMGMARRFAAGKVCTNNPLYGYDYDTTTGGLVVNETEAHWVRQIWQWYADGVSRNEIRRRLITFGAPQSHSGAVRRKHQWSMNLIDNIVQRESYVTGVFVTRWNGQEYEATIPQLIDAATYQAVQNRRQKWKAFPAGNLKLRALVAGVAYCAACGVMMASTSRSHPRNKSLKYYYYRCNGFNRRTELEGCAKHAQMGAIDQAVWERVWLLLSEPDRFEKALQERVAQLRTEDVDAESDATNLERQLDDILLERQRVIGVYRKGIISEDDLETQLMTLTMQERALRKDLTEKRLLTGNRVDRLLEVAEVYRKQLGVGLEALNAEPQTEAQAARQFEFRRKIIETLVKRVAVGGDKSVTVEVEIELSSLYITPIASQPNAHTYP